MGVLSLLALFAGLAAHAAHAGPHWQHEQRLDQQGVLVLRWNSTAPAAASDLDGGVLQVEVAARTRGYVGLGLSPYTGTMAGADLVIAWVDGAGLAHARDYWADQNGTPTLDKAQDWSVVGAVENDTHTVVRLARPLRTRHVMDVAIQPGPTRVIFSWSDADPGQAPHYHGKEQRGVCEVHLLADSASTPTWAHRRAPVVALAAWALVLPCLVRSPL